MTTAKHLSPQTQAALQYLHQAKPLDGYTIERYLALSGKYQVRLKRRNVPIHDEGFEDIVIDQSTGNIVGLQVITSRGDVGRGIVLVDKNGKPCRDKDSIATVKLTNMNNVSSAGLSNRVVSNVPAGSGSSFFGDPIQRNKSQTPVTNIATTTAISDANNQLLIQYFLAVLGVLLAFKMIYSVLNILIIFLVPILYLYAAANCPNHTTFDAKKELKRVMRGAHLPEEQKPKGFFEQGLSRIAASVTTELATSLGYEVSLTDILGAARFACVKVPVANAEFYWIGIFGKWRYIGQREFNRNPDN